MSFLQTDCVKKISGKVGNFFKIFANCFYEYHECWAGDIFGYCIICNQSFYSCPCYKNDETKNVP